MTYVQIDIGGTDYNSYASLAQANDWLAGSLNTAEWDASNDAAKNKLLVSATRLIDLQVFSTTPPDEIYTRATIELTNAFATDPDLAHGNGTAVASKRIKAGSVEIENFRSFETTPGPFTTTVTALLRPYLAATELVGGGAWSYGTSDDSVFEDEDRPTFSGGI